jgi:hypothetical protein
MQFHRQCDYLLRFQAKRRINKSILLRKWSRNAFDVEDNAYETLILVYSRELDLPDRPIILLKAMWKRRTPHNTQKM